MSIQQIATLALEAPCSAAIETISQSIHPNDVVVEMYMVAPQEMCDDKLNRYMQSFEDHCAADWVKRIATQSPA